MLSCNLLTQIDISLESGYFVVFNPRCVTQAMLKSHALKEILAQEFAIYSAIFLRTVCTTSDFCSKTLLRMSEMATDSAASKKLCMCSEAQCVCRHIVNNIDKNKNKNKIRKRMLIIMEVIYYYY
jgi:hypothetical protein